MAHVDEDGGALIDDPRKRIKVELTVNGSPVMRTFRADEVAHMDWNPIINDMADTIARSTEETTIN